MPVPRRVAQATKWRLARQYPLSSSCFSALATPLPLLCFGFFCSSFQPHLCFACSCFSFSYSFPIPLGCTTAWAAFRTKVEFHKKWPNASASRLFMGSCLSRVSLAASASPASSPPPSAAAAGHVGACIRWIVWSQNNLHRLRHVRPLCLPPPPCSPCPQQRPHSSPFVVRRFMMCVSSVH